MPHPRFRSLWRLLLLPLLAVLATAFAPSRAGEPDGLPVILRFVQLSDTHIGENPVNAARLEKAIARINAITDPIVAVVHTGDVLDSGPLNPALEQATALFARLTPPLLAVAGNHDLLPAQAVQQFPQWTQSFGPLARREIYAGVRFLLVCTEPLRGGYALPGYDPLDWLSTQLREAAEAKQPALVFLHVPPADDFYNNAHHLPYPAPVFARLTAVLSEHPPLAVLSGHFHRDELHHTPGYPVFVAPPIANRWGRQGAFRLYTLAKHPDGTYALSYTTQYLED